MKLLLLLLLPASVTLQLRLTAKPNLTAATGDRRLLGDGFSRTICPRIAIGCWHTGLLVHKGTGVAAAITTAVVVVHNQVLLPLLQGRQLYRKGVALGYSSAPTVVVHLHVGGGGEVGIVSPDTVKVLLLLLGTGVGRGFNQDLLGWKLLSCSHS